MAKMSFMSMHNLLPELAERETRSIMFSPEQDSDGRIVPGEEYAFVELFCTDPGCDCRRVMFDVISRKSGGKHEAMITWGWEDKEFYRKNVKFDLTEDDLAELTGPALASGQSQGKAAPLLLDSITYILREDQEYAERVKRHYRLFQEALARKFPTEWWRKKKRCR